MKEFTYLGKKQPAIMKDINDGAVTWNFNMTTMNVKYRMWMDECANLPRCIMLGFDNRADAELAHKTLFNGYNVEFPLGKIETIGSDYYRIFFNMNTRKEFFTWYRESFFPAMRKIGAEFFKKEGFVPINFQPYYVDIHEYDIIHLPENCGYNSYTVRSSIPAYTGQELHAHVDKVTGPSVVVYFDEISIPFSYGACYPQRAVISISDLFDYDKFYRDYIEEK